MLAFLWCCSNALAADRLTFTARWMGLDAGVAEAESVVTEGVRVVTVTARNAGWLDSLYPIDDRIVSRAGTEGGSLLYQTTFREGRFLQDQEMRFTGGGVDVARSQFEDGRWNQYSSHYSSPAGVEDPVSAFYRIREADLQVGDVRHMAVFNGKRTLDIVVTCIGSAPAPSGEPVRHITLVSASEGDFRGGIDLYLSASNVPVLVVVQTRAGPVRIEVQ